MTFGIALILSHLFHGVALHAQISLPPGEVVAVISDYELPPGTLDAAWKTAPVVVHVRVLSSRIRQKPMAGGPSAPVSDHTVAILEIFKGDSLLAGRTAITVMQTTVERGPSYAGPLHSGGGPLFKPSDEYVLFLELLPGDSAFGVAWGAGGAYKLADESVRIPGGARRMWQYRDDMSRTDFVMSLRTLTSIDPTK